MALFLDDLTLRVKQHVKEKRAWLERNGLAIKSVDENAGLIVYIAQDSFWVDGIHYDYVDLHGDGEDNYIGPMFELKEGHPIFEFFKSHVNSAEGMNCYTSCTFFTAEDGNKYPNPYHGLEWDPDIRL